MSQSGNYNEKYTNGDDRCAAETREGFLSVEYTRDIEYTDGAEKDQIGAQLGEQ